MAGKKWTQEQREKFIKTMKERNANVKKDQSTNRNTTLKALRQQPAGGHQADIPPAVLAYALGRTEAWIEGYAASERVSPRTLAYRLGQLLQRKASR